MEPMITFALWSRLHPAHRRRQGATLLPSGLPVDDVAGRRWVVGALAGGTLTIPDLRDGPGTTRALGGVRKIPPQTDRPVPKPPDPVPSERVLRPPPMMLLPLWRRGGRQAAMRPAGRAV